MRSLYIYWCECLSALCLYALGEHSCIQGWCRGGHGCRSLHKQSSPLAAHLQRCLPGDLSYTCVGLVPFACAIEQPVSLCLVTWFLCSLVPGVKNLVEKGYKKISPFFIPYAITNMGGALLAIDTGFMVRQGVLDTR